MLLQVVSRRSPPWGSITKFVFGSCTFQRYLLLPVRKSALPKTRSTLVLRDTSVFSINGFLNSTANPQSFWILPISYDTLVQGTMRSVLAMLFITAGKTGLF